MDDTTCCKHMHKETFLSFQGTGAGTSLWLQQQCAVNQQDLHIPYGKMLFEESIVRTGGLLLLKERKILTDGGGEQGQKDRAGVLH